MQNHLDIEVKNVKVFLPQGEKLFDIRHFEIHHGTHLLIQGESGKGKTTFLHMLAGLFIPKEGSVTIGTQILSQLSDKERTELRRKSIGVVFQKLNLLDHLTVEENLELLSKSSSQVLEKVQLQKKSQQRCSSLSQGEQQRVAVARVLAQKPGLILADEPTSSLDATNADFVMKSLKEEAHGKTLIVVSHDHRIEKYFDSVIQFEEIIK